MYNLSKLKDILCLKKYMLYKSDIIINNFVNISNNIKEKEIAKEKETRKEINIYEKKPSILIDYNKLNRKYNEKKKLYFEDKLFWCFYKLFKNLEDDDFQENFNFMKQEKDFKINIVNKIHNNKEIKDLIKKHKFKKNLVEDELLNSKKISLTTFECLIMLHSMDVFLIKDNKTYTYFNYSINDYDNMDDLNKFKNFSFINLSYKNASTKSNNFNLNIEKNITNLYIDNIINNYYYLENLEKPIKAFSIYKLDELINICNKLNINIYNDTKKRTKKDLYEEILKVLS